MSTPYASLGWLAPLCVLLLPGCRIAPTTESICSKPFRDYEHIAFSSETTCPGCISEDIDASTDGRGGTATRIIFNSDGANPAGGAFDLEFIQGPRITGGGHPGAYVTFPAGEFSNVGISFSTYYEGNKQEDIACSTDAGSGSDSGSGSGSGSCSASFGTIDGAGSFAWYGGNAELEFDQLRIIVTLTGTTELTEVLVHEVCPSK